MKLLVRNLSRDTVEEDLKPLFEKHGKVQFCTIVKDKLTGKSKGFGFVEMPNPGEAKAALKTLNGQEIDGSKVRVKKAQPRVPDSTTEGASS